MSEIGQNPIFLCLISLQSAFYSSEKQYKPCPFLFECFLSFCAGFIVEPATKVAFQTTLNLPGCSNSLSLLGTGFRGKVFKNIGVKVYAAGFYVNPSVFSTLQLWKGRSAAEILEDSSIFSSIVEAPLEKSLQIVLVRDLDVPSEGGCLRKELSYSWLDTFKMNVCISSDGQIPSCMDATIESGNVASSLF